MAYLHQQPAPAGAMIAGIVSLPGMMTGQLLAGVEPVQAVRHQGVLMLPDRLGGRRPAPATTSSAVERHPLSERLVT